jgi:hypothetical protein
LLMGQVGFNSLCGFAPALPSDSPGFVVS